MAEGREWRNALPLPFPFLTTVNLCGELAQFSSWVADADCPDTFVRRRRVLEGGTIPSSDSASVMTIAVGAFHFVNLFVSLSFIIGSGFGLIGALALA